jgi:hypothetical protein
MNSISRLALLEFVYELACFRPHKKLFGNEGLFLLKKFDLEKRWHRDEKFIPSLPFR